MSLSTFLRADAPTSLTRRVRAARKAAELSESLGLSRTVSRETANAPRGPQAALKTETILQALRQSPCPLTTLEVAARVGAPKLTLMAARLSRMASWGQIARQRITLRRPPDTITYCLWSSLPTSSAQAGIPAAELRPGRQLPTTAGPAFTSL